MVTAEPMLSEWRAARHKEYRLCFIYIRFTRETKMKLLDTSVFTECLEDKTAQEKKDYCQKGGCTVSCGEGAATGAGTWAPAAGHVALLDPIPAGLAGG